MTAKVVQRDYSLSGPENRRAVERGLATAKWYHLADPAQAAEGVDAAQGRAGDPRHADMVRRARPVRRAWHLFLGHLVGGAGLCRLWRALWFGGQLPLARMQSRHGLQDPLDERCRVSDRFLLRAARAGTLEMEPCASPYGYHHRRARPRNRRAAADEPVPCRHRLHQCETWQQRAARDPASLLRPARCRRRGLHSGVRALQGLPNGADLRPDLCHGHRLVDLLPEFRCRWCSWACRPSTARGFTMPAA